MKFGSASVAPRYFAGRCGVTKASSQFRCRWLFGVLALASILVPHVGCKTASWKGPKFAKPQHFLTAQVDEKSTALSEIESAYAEARSLESSKDSACVDHYFEAAKLSWHELNQEPESIRAKSGRLWEIYHSSVAKTLIMGQEYGRFDPIAGLEINTPQGKQRVPVHYHGFLWKPEDFNEFLLVGEYKKDYLSTTYRTDGLGIPLIVKRLRSYDEPLRKRKQLFAATALIKNSPYDSGAFTLEMYAPDTVENVALPLGEVAIARAPLAPYTYRMDTKGQLAFRAFRSVGSDANAAGLYSVTPYQPGKIPLILVHGLLSDPTTWGPMASGLLSQPEIHAKYQLWIFEYQTGKPFVESASLFRADLAEARKAIDPNGLDPALDNIILVGHSMGGLVSKLQITSSENHIWDSVAKRPFNQLLAPKEVTTAIEKAYFFTPQPAIKRVVFIGTPHRGANGAQQMAGKVASAVVDLPKTTIAYHRELMAGNPEMFIDAVQKHIPTSINLLDPGNLTLQAVQHLPVSPHVAIHTIIGDKKNRFGEPSDGVVPVTSARHPGTESELIIEAGHTHLHTTPEAIAEVSRILRLHARPSRLAARPSVYPVTTPSQNSPTGIPYPSTVGVR